MFKEFLGNKYQNALLIGTGGGNDIVSATLIALFLQKLNIKTDIAGILSPAAMHFFNDLPEKEINQIKGPIKRLIPTKTPKEISFIDDKLPNILKNKNIKIDNFFDLSLRFGTKRLIERLNNLIKINNYDLLIFVDMGGDILCRGKQDSTILSPMMDFTSLYLAGNVCVDSFIIEFGLGTDGELRPEGMNKILTELQTNDLLLSEEEIKKDSEELKKFREIYSEIEKIRRGHATCMTLQTFDADNEDIKSIYKFKSRIGDKKWLTEFEVILPAKYFRKVYLIDAKKLYESRINTAFNYSNPLEQFIKLKKNETWKTELDLFYLWSKNNWSSSNKGVCLHLLLPSTQINKTARDEIISEGIIHLMDGHCDLSLISSTDLHLVNEAELSLLKCGNFYLIHDNKSQLKDLNSIQEQIIRFQKK